MKPHPRIRRTTKWIGAVVSVVLVVVWIGSRWYRGTWCGQHGHVVAIWGGRLYAWLPLAPSGWREPPGWHVASAPSALGWTYEGGGWARERWIAVPIWPVALSAAIMSLAAWRLDALARRCERVGACPKCRYDRAGLAPDAVCPECGAGAPVPRSAPA